MFKIIDSISYKIQENLPTFDTEYLAGEFLSKNKMTASCGILVVKESNNNLK